MSASSRSAWRRAGRLALALLAGAGSGFGGVAVAQSVLTYHGAADRQGHYIEPALTWAKAKGVHRAPAFKARLLGAVYAQPLYWVPPAGGTGRIIVATEANEVYALNADTGATLWRTSLGRPVPRRELPCGNIDPVGVTGTPVIDPISGSVYLDALVGTAAGPRHKVFGLSLANGAIARGWPIDVAGGLKARGENFDIAPQGQRSALAIVNRHLFVPFAGLLGDCGNYHGWAVGFNLAAPGVSASWATRGQAGGSWGQSGIAYDGTSMFLTTGNTFTDAASPWGDGEAVIRLEPSLEHSDRVTDYFTPADWRRLDARDLDLGGTSAIPIDIPRTAGAPLPRILALGKDGKAYLLDRARLGGIGGQLAAVNVSTRAIITAMAAFPAAGAAMVAFTGEGAHCPNGRSGNLVMLRVEGRAIATAWCASFDGRGAPIVTTTNGAADPIVWVVGAEGDNRLHGFRGTDGQQLFVGDTGGAMSGLHHFETLLVAAHRFYVGADGTVYAFDF